jgi:prevent-host-death family protein
MIALMTEVGVHEAKTHLSKLLRRVAAGEVIVITSGGRPAARLVPVEPARSREFGFDAGVITVPEDFDGPLPSDILEDFER